MTDSNGLMINAITKAGWVFNKKEWLKEAEDIYLFLFKTDDMELKPVDPDNPEARWVHPEKVCGYLTHKKDKQFFRNIFESGLLE